MTALLRGISARFTPTQSSTNLSGFRQAPVDQLFTPTNPAVDGDDCLHDCASCTIHYPRKWDIDETEKLYGHVNGWATHLIIGTGKTDWVRDVQDEKGSVMEAVGKSKKQPSNGKMMLSASNIPIPHSSHSDPAGQVRTTALLLPAFKLIDNVTPASVPDLIQHCVDTAPTNTTLLDDSSGENLTTNNDATASTSDDAPPPSLPHNLSMRDCPHDYLILICSQGTRDARCGQSAPLLRRELERHLRPLGLYRDLEDERPGGVGIYFISHVGGHKFAANLMIYRRAKDVHEAAQCIWLARINPEDCENVVKFTVLQGKVVKPQRQLRGGFDRAKGLVSW